MPLVISIIFESFPKETFEIMNPKNPDLYLILQILLQNELNGFKIRFWIRLKKPKICFGSKNPDSDSAKETHPM